MGELPDTNGGEARRWLANVEDDLRAMRALLRDDVGPGRLVCFLAHLAVEKLLKAVLIDAEVPFTKTHDLEQLHAACAARARLLALDRAELRALNPWAIDGRYADDLRDASTSQAQRSAAFAEDVHGAVVDELRGA